MRKACLCSGRQYAEGMIIPGDSEAVHGRYDNTFDLDLDGDLDLDLDGDLDIGPDLDPDLDLGPGSIDL